MHDDTRERFIVDFAAQLDGAAVIEAHFFAPRRVNGVESGVAVIAATPTAVAGDDLPSIEGGERAPESAPVLDPPMPERYTVYTATYRHTLKGPDRGKWEVTLKAEADAPLVTVDQVVRGVQRRAEDAEEVARLVGAEVTAVVAAHLDVETATAPAAGGTGA